MNETDTALEKSITLEIRAETTIKNMTIKSLAERTHVGYSVLRRHLFLAEPHRSMPLGIFISICEALNVPPQILITQAQQRLIRNE